MSLGAAAGHKDVDFRGFTKRGTFSFESGAFNRSAISPYVYYQWVRVLCKGGICSLPPNLCPSSLIPVPLNSKEKRDKRVMSLVAQ
jgi:hypothetical protein